VIKLNNVRNKLAALIPKNEFVKKTSILVGGTAGAQLLMVLASPILTRLYSPEQFGILAVFLSVLGIFTVIASFRYELAIPLPENKIEAASLVILCLGLVVGVTLFSSLAVYLFGQPFSNYFGVPELNNYIWLLPLAILLVGIYQIFNYWSIRNNQYSIIATTRIKQSVASLLIQILGSKYGSGFLLGGSVGSQCVGSFTLARHAFKDPVFKDVNSANVRNVIYRYRRFPLFSTWSGFFNTLGQQLPPLMFAAYFGATAAGLYVLANRVLIMPMSVVGGAISNVFLSDAARIYEQGKLPSLVNSVTSKLIQIAMPPAILLIFVAPQLFSAVFGDKWQLAGVFAQWMAPWLYFVFVASPLSMLIAVLEKQQQGLIFNGVLLFVRVIGISIGAWYGELMLAVILFSFGSALCWCVFSFWLMHVAGGKLSKVLFSSLKAFALSILLMTPVVLSSFTSIDWWLGLLISSIALCCYYFLLFRKAY
jgi:O-antigen/teichoic acid export membrane protein